MRHSQQVQHKTIQHSKMSSIWRQVVILIKLYCIWSEVSADGEIFESNVMLTWNESRKYCEDIGKVLFDAKKNDYEASLRKILKDTNQAWVSARVEFSDFFKEPVCIAASKQFVAQESFDTDIIGNCFKFCNGYLYAGLKDKDCYCFQDSINLTRSMSCIYTCNNYPFHQCGGKESISLYEKVDKTKRPFIVPGCKECVYFGDIPGFTKYFVESCVGHVADGAVCEGGEDIACNGPFWTDLPDNVCRLNHNSLRWKQAQQYCASIGGHLFSSQTKGFLVNNDMSYWLGYFRISMIHKTKALELDTNDTCCPVARKEGGLVLSEGDDCRAKHAIICQDESLERSSASPQSTDKPFPGCDSECTDTNITYGMVAVSVMLLVALVITALVSIFRRRQVSQESVNDSTTRSTREQHVLLERQITNPPSQPSRHIHTENENLQSSYLTVYFDRGRQDVAMQQPGRSHFD